MPRKVDHAEREATITAIKDAARSLMAEQGTAGLSIRAIAREIGMSAPSLYHYYAGLDDLITDLIVDAFNALADSVEAARVAATDQSPAARMMAAVHAYRRYALDHPTDFQLIYGSPIPGYTAPTEVTVPASSRTLIAFTFAMVDIFTAGDIDVPPEYRDIPAPTRAALRQTMTLAESMGFALPDVLPLYLVMTGWAQIHGIVMLEIFEHIGPVVHDTDVYFESQMRHMLRAMGVRL